MSNKAKQVTLETVVKMFHKEIKDPKLSDIEAECLQKLLDKIMIKIDAYNKTQFAICKPGYSLAENLKIRKDLSDKTEFRRI